VIVRTQNFRLSKKFTPKSYFFKVKEKSSFSIFIRQSYLGGLFRNGFNRFELRKKSCMFGTPTEFFEEKLYVFFWNFLNLEGKRPQNYSKKINFFFKCALDLNLVLISTSAFSIFSKNVKIIVH
jgi:hypothetical protein